MCSLQVIECDFSYAGCSEKLQRQDMEKHVEENTQKHLALMAAVSMKMSQEFQKRLQEQQDDLQQQVERIEKLEKQLKDKEQELEQLNMKLRIPPFHFTVSNFNQLKTKNTIWYSPPMYTHLHGYKLCIAVWPNGLSGGRGTHVGVYLYSMSGEFDATLQWPAKFTITLQLLNQHRDQDHITVTHQFQWNKPEGERVSVDWFTTKLIAHTDLELNAQKQTQYLKDDCLHFRITKIEAQK